MNIIGRLIWRSQIVLGLLALVHAACDLWIGRYILVPLDFAVATLCFCLGVWLKATRGTYMTLAIWTIYDHPKDFPDCFVARRFVFDQPTLEVLAAPSLELLRNHMRALQLTPVPRSEHDSPSIVESWL